MALNVLFIGNSHTFFNDLPSIFRNIAKADGRDLCVRSILCGGHTLEQDVDPSDDYGRQVYELLPDNSFDFVILQENSDELNNDSYYPERFERAVRILNEMIRRSGAQPILYSTWGNRLDKNQIDKVKTHKLAIRNKTVGEKLDVPVAYAGFGFEKIYSNPDNVMNLHYKDNHHPSESGSYLAAMTIYQTMFPDRDVRNIGYDFTLPSDDAKNLRSTAYEITKDPSGFFN